MTYLKPLAAAFCAALTAASAPLFGQTAIPNTPAGKVLRVWVDAYNSVDSARMAMFFRTYSVEDALRGAFAFRKMTGGLAVWATGRLEGNVGHLRFDGFVDPGECGSTIVTAITALAETKALIIDLRENAGGGKAGSTPLLESYLFDRRTHLSDVRFRYTGDTRERWTLDSVAGARFGGEKPVYVLTSAHTLSAGEELAYDLQALKRATVVGETTSGQAHATFEARIENHFGVLLPTGKTLNPVTGTDWEGVGVVPDVKVPASEALTTAQRLLREKLPH